MPQTIATLPTKSPTMSTIIIPIHSHLIQTWSGGRTIKWGAISMGDTSTSRKNGATSKAPDDLPVADCPVLVLGLVACPDVRPLLRMVVRDVAIQ